MAKDIPSDEDYEDIELPEDEDSEDLDDDLDFDNEDFIEPEEEKGQVLEESAFQEQEEVRTEQQPEEEILVKEPITTGQIPIEMVVEVGSIRMPIEQLLKLEPGNLLDINIHPRNEMDLTINGKLVGRGELVRIGDALAIRVLQLG